METADLLLEIGTEEIPAGYIPKAVDQLATKLTAFLTERGVEVEADAVQTFATPRRLTVRIPKVPLMRPLRTETRLGPAVKAAFDGDGNPTPAAQGFARSAGITPDQLQRVDTDKGERVAAEVTSGGESTRDLLLSDGMLESLLQLGFPKTMRWIPGSDLRFARPIRWLVCLLGPDVVPLRLAHLTADRVSRGHRTLDPRPVEIAEPSAYEASLRAASVEVDPEARRRSIAEGAERLAAEAGGTVVEAPDLLDELTYLSEHPFPVRGTFAPELVELLPREVIVAAMRSHQRYFSVEKDGQLLPCFLTFRDGGDRGIQNVVEGNERVLRARLEDARFYWDEDRSLDSDAKLAALDRIVWLEGRGSIGDKCRRIAALAGALAPELAPGVDATQLERASLLSKSDLATEMIKDGKEFTKLQGLIGRYYALEAGEPEAVADAIAEHLHPKFASDRLPAGDLARLIALADRLDSITGCTLAGFAPTGSQDPYALRRQAFAVLRLLIEGGWRLDLLAWADRALGAFGDPEAARDEARGAIADLFWGRLETLLSDLPAELVRGVLSVSTLDPVENSRAARALAELRGQESFDQLLEGAKRCRNILVKEKRLSEEDQEPAARAQALQAKAAEVWEAWVGHSQGGPISFDPSLFSEAAEESLHAAVLAAVPRLAEARASEEPARIYAGLAGLGGDISRYFEEVLVNDKDPRVRSNRLGFLEALHYLFGRFADLSRVPAA